MIKIHVEKTDTFAGHKDCIYALTGGLPKNIFYTSGADGLVAKWDLSTPDVGELVAKIGNTVYAICHLPESNSLIIAQNFEGIHQVSLETKQEIRSLKLTSAPIFDMKVLGNRLFLVTGDGVLIVVDLAEWAVIKHLKASDKNARTIALLPERNHIAIGYSDHTIRVFDCMQFTPVHAWQGHQNSVFSLQYSPDGRFLLSGSRDAHLKIWEVGKDYQPFSSIVAHMFTINHIAFSPSGKFFATCSKDKSVKVWDAEAFRLLKVIDKARHAGHGTSVNKLYWAAEDVLVSASDDRTISVWKLDYSDVAALK